MPLVPIRRLPRFAAIGMLGAITFSLGLSGCGGDADEAEPDPIFDTAERGLIDCSERTDTGYTNGNAFQITLITVDGKPAEKETGDAYWVMQQAADGDGVRLAVVSGFRTMSE